MVINSLERIIEFLSNENTLFKDFRLIINLGLLIISGNSKELISLFCHNYSLVVILQSLL